MYLTADDLKTLGDMVRNLDKLMAAFNGNVKHTTRAGHAVTLSVSYDQESGSHYLTFPNPS